MKSRISRRYLAGLIDGEGYISIKPGKSKAGIWFGPVIKMALTEKSAYILFEIKELLGGYVYRRTYKNPKYNVSFYWEVYGFDNVEKVLRYILPYLILKKEQAKLVLSLIKTKIPMTISKNGTFVKMNESIVNKRRSLYYLVKKMNERGRLPASTEREHPQIAEKATVRTLQQCKDVNGTETLTPSLN